MSIYSFGNNNGLTETVNDSSSTISFGNGNDDTLTVTGASNTITLGNGNGDMVTGAGTGSAPLHSSQRFTSVTLASATATVTR